MTSPHGEVMRPRHGVSSSALRIVIPNAVRDLLWVRECCAKTRNSRSLTSFGMTTPSGHVLVDYIGFTNLFIGSRWRSRRRRTLRLFLLLFLLLFSCSVLLLILLGPELLLSTACLHGRTGRAKANAMSFALRAQDDNVGGYTGRGVPI